MATARPGSEMSDREYPARPIVGIGIVVIKGDHVLLCQRGKPPNVGTWTLPGGAQEVGETCEEAARRELLEEAGWRSGTCISAPTWTRSAAMTMGASASTTRSSTLPPAGWPASRLPGRTSLRRRMGAAGRAGAYELW